MYPCIVPVHTPTDIPTHTPGNTPKQADFFIVEERSSAGTV
jgi:hypothetical protein